MEIGIIGLPNVGKSTLFNALTKAKVPAENFPFTTIEPNVGVGLLRDERLNKLGEIFQPEKLTSATVKFVDIAGLVKGASKGEGLGNKFLSHIREVDALLQVVRAFPGDKVVNTLGKFDPVLEIEIVELEMILADIEHVVRLKEKVSGLAKSGDKTAKEKLNNLDKLNEYLNTNKPIRDNRGLISNMQDFDYLTSKSILYLFNVNDLTPEDCIARLNEYARKKANVEEIIINVQVEFELTQLTDEEKVKFHSELGLEAGLGDLIKEAYKMLNLITFYTVVGKEVRAWSIPEGTIAKKAAGKVHSDMEEGFIRAEVYPFSELVKQGSEKTLYENGLVKTEGKDYVVSDGDIMKFHFS
jgi:GTP-binding protein YchF